MNNKKTIVMGILNCTPDSFSDGGVYFDNPEKAVDRVRKMLQEGADIIDIGGESTKPQSKPISDKEEIRRVVPLILKIRKQLGNDFIISIDTYKSTVAQKALDVGATMVNSLGGFMFDNKMIDVIAKYQCNVVIYHIKGNPKTMQIGEITHDNIINDISTFFEEQIKIGLLRGVKREQFIIDPGIGFGKTVEQNLEIIKKLSQLKKLKLPILIGVSRKSHLGKIVQEELMLENILGTNDRLEAALAETAIAVVNGTKIIRTHDVLQTKKFLSVIDILK